MLRVHRLKESLLLTALLALFAAAISRIFCLSGYIHALIQLEKLWPRVRVLALQLASSCAATRNDFASIEAVYALLLGVLNDFTFIIRSFSRELCVLNLVYLALPLLEGE